MSVLLYAVAQDASLPGPAGTGIGGRALRKLSTAGLAALVSEEPSELRPTEEALLSYEQVMERLMALMPVLPVRFGTVVADDSAVTALLHERRSEFASALSFVQGAVELIVQAEWPEPCHDPDPARPGTDYMRSRLAAHRRSRDLERSIELSLADVARATASRTPVESASAFKASYLVAAGDVAEFLRRLAELDRSTEDVTFWCTGPWPPYSFVTAGTP